MRVRAPKPKRNFPVAFFLKIVMIFLGLQSLLYTSTILSKYAAPKPSQEAKDEKRSTLLDAPHILRASKGRSIPPPKHEKKTTTPLLQEPTLIFKKDPESKLMRSPATTPEKGTIKRSNKETKIKGLY
jgi:hypothetical protein